MKDPHGVGTAMTDRSPILAALALIAFTLLSSFLGLSGRFFLSEPSDSLGFMAEIWSASAIADVVFIVGSLAAATGAFLLARTRPGIAIVVSLAANWLVYYLSFILLPAGTSEIGGTAIGEALWFVGAWGAPGLVFAMLAPPLAALWWEKRAAADDADLAPA